MCGIFGVLTNNLSNYSQNKLNKLTDKLFILSESRGKEASGFALKTDFGIDVLKMPKSAKYLINSPKYKTIFSESFGKTTGKSSETQQWSFIGHSRLVTNGSRDSNDNNQPVIKDGTIGVHNGIITNDLDLWHKYPELIREETIDTEVLLAIINSTYLTENSVEKSVKKGFSEIEGNTSIALLFDNTNEIVLATNTGSIYYSVSPENDLVIFASEKYILSEIHNSSEFKDIWKNSEISQVKAGMGILINPVQMDLDSFSIIIETNHSNDGKSNTKSSNLPEKIPIIDHSEYSNNTKKRNNNLENGIYIGNPQKIKEAILQQPKPGKNLKRCTKCLLPETFPHIHFDENGVCNYCHSYQKTELKSENSLKEIVSQYKNTDGKPDCLIGFSGGRDSSYALHYAKKTLGINPIAFTYDWGMVTDLARRNCSRVTGKLGVEHIIVSADIEAKRLNIRKNLNAWLKKPDLGMIPILMAGDKQFYYHAHKLIEQTGIQLVLGGATPYEKTDFKLGFCGIGEDDTRGKGLLTGIKIKNKIKLVLYYLKQYILNPAYINSSIFDTMHAFYSAYVLPDAYLNVYDYVKWDEEEIASLLINEYNWEIATDTPTTWRIGDGTAAFYNYVYYTVAGFTENDTFRSNQIREGVISREEGLKLIEEENKPRIESLIWYAETVGFNLEEALDVIHSIPKLWDNNI